jgi:hypothetical protein
MADDIVARYTLKFNDLASKKLLRVAGTARAASKALQTAAVATGVLAVAGTAAAVRYANAWAKSTDELGKFAKKSGVAIGTLSQLQTAMQLQGGSIGDVQTGIETLNKRIGELRIGTGALHTILKKSDPAFAAQLRGVTDTNDAMELALGYLAKTETAQDRAAISAALFGRTAGASYDLLTKDGIAGYLKLMKEVERLRPVLTPEQAKIAAAYNDQLLLAKTAMLSLGDAGAGGLLPTLTSIAHRFTEFVASNRELINSKITDFVKAFSSAIAKINFGKTMTYLNGFGKGLREVAGYAERFIDAIGGPTVAIKVFAASLVAAKILPFIGLLSGMGKGLLLAGTMGVKLVPVLKLIGTGALFVGKALLPLIASLGAPILIIGGLIAAGALLWANWDTVKATAKSMGFDLDAVWLKIKTGFTALKNVAVQIFTAIGFAMINPVGAAKAVVIATISSLSEVWNSIMSGIGSVAENVWSGIKSTFMSGVEWIKAQIDKLIGVYNGVTSFFGGQKAISLSQSGSPAVNSTVVKPLQNISQSVQNGSERRAQFAASSRPLSGTVWVKAEKGTELSRNENGKTDVSKKGVNFSLDHSA